MPLFISRLVSRVNGFYLTESVSRDTIPASRAESSLYREQEMTQSSNVVQMRTELPPSTAWMADPSAVEDRGRKAREAIGTVVTRSGDIDKNAVEVLGETVRGVREDRLEIYFRVARASTVGCPFTQRAVAKRIGKSASWLWQLEHGHRKTMPRYRDLLLLSLALEFSLRLILEEKSPIWNLEADVRREFEHLLGHANQEEAVA